MSLIAECRSLVEVRSHIDRLDGELLALLAQRAAYVVGPAKPCDTFSGKDFSHFSTQ